MFSKSKKDKHPLAINIKKLQRYNYSYFGCEEVVFFEYMVVKGNAFKHKPFYHSSETIFNETGIKKHSLNSIIKRFEALGYISIEVKGMPKVKHFTVHYPKIEEDLPKIYVLEENGQPLYDFRQLLAEFYLPLVESYQEKNINKNTISNIKKEKNDSISEDDKKLKIFANALSLLQLKFNLTPTQYNYRDVDVIKALVTYEMEELTFYLDNYFNQNKKGKLSGFFKFNHLNNHTLDFIEQAKAEEEQFIENYLESLQETYDHRLRMYNKDSKQKRAKSKTTLVFNANIKVKIKEALKVHGEIGVTHAFMAYTDAVLKGDITPDKFLPYFFSKQYGEFGVIETYLDHFNINYGYDKK